MAHKVSWKAGWKEREIETLFLKEQYNSLKSFLKSLNLFILNSIFLFVVGIALFW